MRLPPVVADPSVQATERAQHGGLKGEWFPRAHAVQRLVRVQFAHAGKVEEEQALAWCTGWCVMLESYPDELVLDVSDFAEEDVVTELEPDHVSQVRRT